MLFSAGTQLGSYEIVAPIGSGGMGQVYRARDTKLGREVAIKLLSEAFTGDAERRARFEREARMLASLNHPNIAAIYGLEEFQGGCYLALELVPGQTLADRLKEGPLHVREVLEICRQIADGLEAAHEKGIIHRDLKPANVMVTPDGKVKILDFGVAKIFVEETSAGDASQSPTITSPATQQGMVLGTVPFMSPEQVRGKELDRRSDIWSFGCVLYELLTGRRTFPGGTVADITAAILERDPDWSALPKSTPSKVQDLLRRCLQKDLHRRLHDIADARIETDEALSESVVIHPRRPLRWQRAFPWVLVGILAAIAGTAIWISRHTALQNRNITRFAISVPLSNPISFPGMPGTYAVAISPDGRRFVYVARHDGNTQLQMRALDRMEATTIPGTEGVVAPFFSPESNRIGFFADGKLKRLDLVSGDVAILCDARWALGASWGPDDNILFVPAPTFGIWRVSAGGGERELVISPDFNKGERSYRFPEILPNGKAVLFTVTGVSNGGSAEMSIMMLIFATGERRVMLHDGSNARYAKTGHLIYARDGSLLAVPFDLERLEISGTATPVLQDVLMDAGTAAAQFALSKDGDLVYVPGGVQVIKRMLLWVDRKGASRLLTQTLGSYGRPSLSPDGRRLTIEIADGTNTDLWVHDLERGTFTRITYDAESMEMAAIWTPNGERVTFASNRAGPMDIFWTPVDGSGPNELLLSAPLVQWPSSWSPDGRLLVFMEMHPTTGYDIWLLPLESDRKPQPFLRTSFDERQVSFSPDGHWLTYTSNESGRDEIYVREFPGSGQKWQISTEGGSDPVWSPTGQELFYRSSNKMMVVSIMMHPTFTAGKPSILFEANYERGNWALPYYDVSPDGQHFVMIKETEAEVREINVVLNWFEELKHLSPRSEF